MSKPAAHDMGGQPAGPVDRTEHGPTLTERRIDAMMTLMRDDKRRLWLTDENRRTIESMTPEHYEGRTYYARWVYAMRALLIEKGVVSEAEVQAKLAAVTARLAAATPGDRT